jgi:DNA adenine methylase
MSDELDFMSLIDKKRSLDKLLPLLPYSKVYIEPFGGSGTVLLARRPCKIEVFNDRNSGVIDFYRCIKDADLLERLVDRLDLVRCSREEWLEAKGTWTVSKDPVERAAL